MLYLTGDSPLGPKKKNTPMFKRLSIAENLNLILTSVFFIAAVILCGVLIALKFQSIRDQIIAKVEWSLRVDGVLPFAVYFGDREVSRRYLNDILEDEFVGYAAIVGARGQVLFDERVPGAYEGRSVAGDWGDSRAGLRAGRVEEVHFFGDDNFLDVEIPIYADIDAGAPPALKDYTGVLVRPGEGRSRLRVGYLQLGLALDAMKASLVPYAKNVFLGMLALWLAGSFALVILTTVMTNPLRRLTALVKEITVGNLDKPLRVRGTGEVRRLTAMLNLIIEELNKHKAQVDVDNKLLSMKVKERTEQLWRRNEELNSAVEQVTEAEKRLRYLAYYDGLTALPNRQLFIEQLSLLINLAQREHTTLALLFMDLDNFKRINDSLGHSIGDELLRKVASRLVSCLRKSDVLAKFNTNQSDMNLGISRLGGDEFTVLLNNISSEDNAAATAERILEAMKDSFHVEGHEITVTPSVGIAIAPRDASTVEELLKLADTAMYHAKKAGRNTFKFYSPVMDISNVERLQIETDLRRAVEREEMMLHYQPQVDARTGDIVGAEALVRWFHPQRGFIPPAQFIPLAEEMGLIVDLGAWILNEACRQAREIARMGLVLPKMSVNVSSLQFTSSFVGILKEAINSSGIDPSQLELELTESVIMNHAESVTDDLRQIKSLGVSISVDDFGTGYSSLNYLSRFPLDELKIDRSFIVELDSADAEGNSGLVVAIIAMAKSLNLRLVAEGVDSVDQFDFLRKRGVDRIQGYLFSKPLSLEEFILLMEDNPFPRQISRMSRQLEHEGLPPVHGEMKEPGYIAES